MKHPHRTGLTVAVGAALCLPMLAVTTAATAHEGHDDTAPPRPPSSSRRSPSTTARARPSTSPCCPTATSCTPRARASIWHNDSETGVNSVAGRIPVYLHDEEGLQSIALDPGYDGKKNTWVYLYYSPPLDTPADDPATASINEGDAPETGTAADFAPYKGYPARLEVPLRRRPGRARLRAARCSTSRSTAASAATSAATSSSTPRAT